MTAFLLAAKDVITDEQRRLYAEEHAGASLDAALGGETCIPVRPMQDEGTSEELVEVQDHKGLHQWLLNHLAQGQRDELSAQIAVHAKVLKEKRQNENGEQQQKQENLALRNKVIHDVLTEEQLRYIQSQHDAIVGAATAEEKSQILESFEQWKVESITAEQDLQMRMQVGKAQVHGEVASQIEAQVDDALLGLERSLLEEMGMEPVVLSQFDTLAGMQKAMLLNPKVAEREKEIVRETHDKWIAGQLTAEQYSSFKKQMGKECDRLIKEKMDDLGGLGAGMAKVCLACTGEERQ